MWKVLRLLVLIWLLLPIPSAGMVGSYNPITNLAYCPSNDICLHETGHAIDRSLGYPSQSEEFKTQLQIFIVSEFKEDNPSDLSIKVMNTVMTSKQNTMREVYANLYKWSGGNENNLPKNLAKFYDWNFKYNSISLGKITLLY